MLCPSIFKAYDIRGVVPRTLDANAARQIALAFAQAARAKGERTVAVGRDGRLSGPQLKDALVAGLRDGGLDVIDIGLVATPMLSHAACTLARSGIQITASHNPPAHNGFKMTLAGESLFGEGLQQLRRAVEAGVPDANVPQGGLRTQDVLADYRDRIAQDVRLARPLKVVVDCGNGAAGVCAPEVLRAIGCEVVELYCDVDGTFPHHHPDPAKPENLQDLVRTVRETGAELGLGFDGDGDRLGVVTRSGEIVFPDRLMMLFARDVLRQHPGATIPFDVKSTQRLAPVIREAGGQPLMVASGYALLKQRMRELKAPLAGEMSGHIFFADRWPGFDDATYSAARLLEIVSRAEDAGAVLQALPDSVSTPELHVPCAEGESHAVAARIAQIADFPGAEVSTIDGLRVDWPDGFGLVRGSNTTPVLTLRFEGHTQAAMERIQREMMALLREVKPDAEIAGGH